MNVLVIDNLLRIAKKHVFFNVQANYYNRAEVYALIGHFADKIVDIHIWEKSNPMPAAGNAVTNAIEYFIVLGEGALKANFTYTKNIITTSVYSKMPSIHKAVMNPIVAEHFIVNYTDEGDRIIDPFMGLGTTGVTCKKFKRKFIGIERDAEYYNYSVNAINQKDDNDAFNRLFGA